MLNPLTDEIQVGFLCKSYRINLDKMQQADAKTLPEYVSQYISAGSSDTYYS
jgi:hypothetical protein